MKVSVMLPQLRQTAFATAVGISQLIAPKVSAQAIVTCARKQRAQWRKWNGSS